MTAVRAGSGVAVADRPSDRVCSQPLAIGGHLSGSQWPLSPGLTDGAVKLEKLRYLRSSQRLRTGGVMAMARAHTHTQMHEASAPCPSSCLRINWISVELRILLTNVSKPQRWKERWHLCVLLFFVGLRPCVCFLLPFQILKSSSFIL